MAVDTICAIATPPGQGGVGIVRVSGPLASSIAATVAGPLPTPRTAAYRRFRDAHGEPIDSGLLLWFPAPHSFTGEDVVEFQGHGGPLPLDQLLRRLIGLGARLARPGEFSERAFLNGKLDLVQAEAVADLIAAGSEAAARAAIRSLTGAFSRQVQALTDALIALRVQVEAAIDFPEEELDLLAESVIGDTLSELQARVNAVRGSAAQGQVLRDGMTVVIVGRPNSGKSSLLNCLAQTEAAIVTDVPGTTRDLLRERIQIDGMPLHVIDTAGLRAADDPVEAEGIRRAWRAIADADRLLLLVDDREGLGALERQVLAERPSRTPVTVVANKIDLSGAEPAITEEHGLLWIRLSAKTGSGLALLREHLKQCMGYTAAEGAFTARRRHLEALDRAGAHLQAAAAQRARGAAELMAEELRHAQRALGEITGEFTTEDLLGAIFSSFCIGK